MAPPVAARRALIAAPYLRVLRNAAELAGGETALAAALGVAPERLQSWLCGDVVPPVASYMAALEIVERARASRQGEEWNKERSHSPRSI